MKMKFKKFLLGLILLIVFTGIFTKMGEADAVWSIVPGCGGTNGLNTTAGVAAHQPAIAVCNSALYAAWVERPSSANEIHIKKFEGGSWTNVGNTSGQTKLNISSGDAGSPTLIAYNGALYAAWHEQDSSANLIHVKRYSGGSWTFVQNYAVGDGRNCINANPVQNAKEPTLLVFNNELYAAWQEFLVSGVPQIRVSKFNDSSGLWSSVDGSGLNRNTNKTATRPSLAVYTDPVSGMEHLYISWLEENSSGNAQIRVRKYNGGTSWTFIDDVTNVNNTAGTENGLNKEPTENNAANMPVLAAYNGALYVAWAEGTYDRTGWGAMSQIRLRRYNGTSWAWVDGGLDPGLNKNCQVPAVNPVLMAFGSKLYLTWEEIWEKTFETEFYSQIRVMKYDGTTPSFIDGNIATGLNFVTTHDKDAYYPNFTVYNGDLYVVWHENNTTADQIRMKSYPLPPVVTSVTVPANATYKTGQNLDFVVNFNKAVNVIGSPVIPVTFNSGSYTATYLSGSGTSALTFRRTILSGDNDNDGIAVGSTINLSGGTIRDTVNNLDADLNLNNVPSTAGVLVDTVIPTASSFTPADNELNVSTSTNLVINFNKNIAKGTGNITIKKTSDDSTVETINVSGTNVTVSGSSVTIVPATTLLEGTGYYILIDDTAFHDTAGNNYGINNKNSWNFTTTDPNPPSGYTVSIDQPYINNNNKTNMSFTFAGAEVGTTYNYTLTSSGGGTPVTGSGTINSATQQVTGVTTFGLNEGTLTLSVTLTDPALNVGTPAIDTVLKDTLMPSGYSVSIDQAYINITTPTAMSFQISGAETGASFTYSITSSGGGAAINGSGLINSGTTKTISGINTTGLADGTLTVSVTMTDVPGNTGLPVTDTVVKDLVSPTITGASLAANNSYLDITFSEGVYGASNGTGALTADKLNLTFTPNGSTVTVSKDLIKQNNSEIASSATNLTGGETTVRLFLTTNGYPTGIETIRLTALTGIYDKAGNEVSTSQTTGDILLNQIRMTISSDQALSETSLNGRLINVALYGTTFKTTLDKYSFHLVSGISGLSIQSVTRNDDSHCTIQLSFDGPDFSSNGTLQINIDSNQLNYSSNLISDNTLIISADKNSDKTVSSYKPTSINDDILTAYSYRNTFSTTWNDSTLYLGKNSKGSSSDCWLYFPKINLTSQVDRAELVLTLLNTGGIVGDNKTSPRRIKVYMITDPDNYGKPYFGSSNGFRSGLNFSYRDFRPGWYTPWRKGADNILEMLGSNAPLDVYEFIPQEFYISGGTNVIKLDVTDALKAWKNNPGSNQGFYIVAESNLLNNDQILLNGAVDKTYLQIVYSTSDTVRPAKVSNFTVQTTMANSVSLQWNPAGMVRVLRKLGSVPAGPEEGTIIFDGLGSNCTDSGLEKDKTYYYAIFAYDSNRTYSTRSWVKACTGNWNTVVADPTGFTALALSATAIKLDWLYSSNNESGFVIERRISGGQWSVVTSLPANQITYQDNGLLPDTNYEYRIKAINPVGSSAYVTAAPVKTSNELLAPTNLSGKIISAHQVLLKWTDSLNETGYRIEIILNSTGATLYTIDNLPQNIHEYRILGLSASTDYRFTVSAIRGSDTPASVTTELITTPPDVKSGIH